MKKSIINKSYLWEKIHEYARKAGRASTRPLLLMYYVLKSDSTPKSAKAIIYGSLAYLILPINVNNNYA